MAAHQTNPPNIHREEPDILTGDELVCISAFSLDKQLREFLKEIWFSKELSDFILTANGEKFKTHKFLLKAHTEYFSKSPELLNQSGTALDLKPNTLELVLTFLYLGQVMVPKQGIPDVAATAEFLGVDLLKKQCRYALLSDADLKPENCLDIWTAARDTEKKLPAEKALKVALENFDDLQHEAGFKELPLDCIQEYLPHSGLQLNTEDERLSAAMTWIMADKSRMQHLLSLLKLLPLKDMHFWYLKQVLHSPCVRDQTEAQAFLANVLDELTGKKPPQEPDTSPMESITDPEECTADIHNQKSMGKSLGSPTCQPWLVVVDKENYMWGLKLQKDICVVSFGKVPNAEAGSIASDGDTLYMTGLLRIGHERTVIWKYSNQEKTFQEVTSSADKGRQKQQFRTVGSFSSPSMWSVLCSMNQKLYIIDDQSSKDQVIKAYDPLHNPDTPTRLSPLMGYSSMIGAACCALPQDDSLAVVVSLRHNDKSKHIIELYSVAKQQTIMAIELPRLSDYLVYRIFHVTSPSKFIVVAGDYTAVVDVTELKKGHTGIIQYSDKYIVPNLNCMVALSSDRQYIMLLGGKPKTPSPMHHYYRAPVQSIINNTGRGWEKLQSDNPITFGTVSMKAYNVVELPADYEPYLIY